MKKIFLLLTLITNTCCAQMGEWTWMNGPSMANQAAVYGTQSVFAAGNRPPCSYEACQWTDHQGYFWLFGGTGTYNDDLWKFDPSINQWAWIKGPGVGNQPGVYGTFQVPSAANNPGGRGYGEITWTDNFNNLWMYGGYGKDVNNSQGFLGDLWEYNIATNEWTWMSGADTFGTVPVYGTMGVPDPANTPGGRNECNAAWVDDNNNLWLYGGDLNLNADRAGDLWMYNTAINQWAWMSGTTAVNATPVWGIKGVPNSANMPGGRFCYTSWKSCDGDFWMFGGSDYNDMWRYNIASNMWTWMSGTSTIGAAGISNGTCIPDTGNIPEGKTENRACWNLDGYNFVNYGGDFFSDLWNFNTITLEWTLMNGQPNTSANPNFGTILVSSPTNTPGDRGGALGFKDNNGNLWLFGGFGFMGDHNDMWKFVPDTTCPVIINCESGQGQVNFVASNNKICEKFCISFYDSSANNPTSWQWIFPGGSPSFSTLQNPTGICYDVPGIYDVTLITTSAGGNDTLTFPDYITVYPTPPFPTITQVGYTLTSSIATFYQWQLNSNDIPGATNQSYTVLQTGYYTVLVSDSNGCENSFSTYVLISGVGDVNADTNISIYPNPATDGLVVEWLNSFTGEKISLSMVNAIGQKIFSSGETISSVDWKQEIELRVFAPGVYFLEIESENISLKKKIIIIK